MTARILSRGAFDRLRSNEWSYDEESETVIDGTYVIADVIVRDDGDASMERGMLLAAAPRLRAALVAMATVYDFDRQNPHLQVMWANVDDALARTRLRR